MMMLLLTSDVSVLGNVFSGAFLAGAGRVHSGVRIALFGHHTVILVKEKKMSNWFAYIKFIGLI